MVLLMMAALAWGVDTFAGPLGTRITDRRDEGDRLRLVAVASQFADATGLLDFVDAVKETYHDKQVLELDIVSGKQGADLYTMDAAPPEQWTKRVLLSYRRNGKAVHMVLATRLRR